MDRQSSFENLYYQGSSSIFIPNPQPMSQESDIFIEDIQTFFTEFAEEVEKLIQKSKIKDFHDQCIIFRKKAFKAQLDKSPRKIMLSQEILLDEPHPEELQLKIHPQIKTNKAIKRKNSRKLSPNRLKEALNKKTSEAGIINEIPKDKKYNLSSLTSYINSLSQKIDIKLIKLKSHFMELGQYLKYAKEYCKYEKLSFTEYVAKYLCVKDLSTITNYIRFYQICRENPDILNCNLTMTQVLQNHKEIKQLLNQP